MSAFGGEVYQTPLSKEDEEKLKKALDHEQVSAAADEIVEIDWEAGASNSAICRRRT